MGEYVRRGEGGAEGNYFLMTDKDLRYCTDVSCGEVCWTLKLAIVQASLIHGKTINGLIYEFDLNPIKS